MGTCLGLLLLPSNPLAAGAMRLWRRHEGRSHNTMCVTSFFISEWHYWFGFIVLVWDERPSWTSRFSCVQVLVKAGDKVTVGDPLMVMIAMKMEVRHWWFLPFSRCTHTDTHCWVSNDVTSCICLCSIRSGHQSQVWSRRFSSARALRPTATLLWLSWWRRKSRRRGATSKRIKATVTL